MKIRTKNVGIEFDLGDELSGEIRRIGVSLLKISKQIESIGRVFTDEADGYSYRKPGYKTKWERRKEC